MKTEYIALALMTIFYLFAWFPLSVGKLKSFGGKWLASNRNPLPGKELLPWAARCERAYNNLKDYFPAYVVAILLLGQLEKFDTSTEVAAIMYVVARVIHFISYGMGNVPFRALSFFIGLFSNLFLLIKIIVS